MALQLSLTTNDTVEHQEAYCKIIRTEIDWLYKRAGITLGFWHDQKARDGDTPARTIKKINFALTDNFDSILGSKELDHQGKNIISQLYTWIKTQDDLQGINFTESEDV